MTSPARAGNTVLAANPTAVARNALPNRTFLSGSSRYCHRYARIARFATVVANDSISHGGSAFDYVLASGIPDKGKVLTQISAFWFDRTHSIVPNHVVSTDPAAYPPAAAAAAGWLRGRSMLVQRTDPLPIECVARGYLSGSG